MADEAAKQGPEASIPAVSSPKQDPEFAPTTVDDPGLNGQHADFERRYMCNGACTGRFCLACAGDAARSAIRASRAHLAAAERHDPSKENR